MAAKKKATAKKKASSKAKSSKKITTRSASASKATNPKLGAEIDALFKLRQKSDAAEAKAKAAKKVLTDAMDALLEKFDKNDLNGARGKLASVSVVKTENFNIVDQDTFGKYVLKNKALDLLQRRVSVTAVRERMEAGKKVPGLETFTKVSLRLNSAR